MEGVTVGRVVHYVPFPNEADNEECYAAIITGVVVKDDPPEVNLNVATNGNHYRQGVYDHGHEPWIFRPTVPYSASNVAGSWHWPERA